MTRNKLIQLAYLVLLVCLLSCSSDDSLTKLAPDAKILAFGDSLTYGSGVSRTNSYPAILESLLQRQVINGGIPGETSLEGLKRLPALLQKHQPDLLILCHGGNDLLRKLSKIEAKNNIQKMVQLAQQQNIGIVLVGVPSFGIILSSEDFYRDIADKYDIPLEEDIIPLIESDPSLKSDQVHPNREGYALLAEAVVKLLQEYGAI